MRTARGSSSARAHRAVAPRILAAALAGAACALLVSCGSSGKGLIPASAAGPLQSDFEAVQQAAENANGDCGATEAAMRKTEEDLAALPASVDSGLRGNLRQGIDNLRVRAHEMCSQPSAQATTATAPKTSTSTPTTTPTTPSTTTSTPTTPATTTPNTTPESHGGTPAPGEEGEESSEHAQGGSHGGGGAGGSGGTGAEGVAEK